MELSHFPFHVWFIIFSFVYNIKDRKALASCSKELYDFYQKNKYKLPYRFCSLTYHFSFASIASLFPKLGDPLCVVSCNGIDNTAVSTQINVKSGTFQQLDDVIDHILLLIFWSCLKYNKPLNPHIKKNYIAKSSDVLHGHRILVRGNIMNLKNGGRILKFRTYVFEEQETNTEKITGWVNGHHTTTPITKYSMVKVLVCDVKLVVSKKLLEILQTNVTEHFLRFT